MDNFLDRLSNACDTLLVVLGVLLIAALCFLCAVPFLNGVI